MIIHSPVISGSLTFANGATFTLPPGGIYSGSFSGSYQGASFTGGTFSGIINSTNGVVSGSSQVSYVGLSNIPAGIVSSSTQIDTLFNLDGVVSGSSQVISLLPAGTISGSSQVNADTITNFDENVLAYNNSLAVVSGSASSVKTFLSLDNVTNESKATMFSSPTFTGTVSGVTATHVGLGNVTNESKATMFTNAALTGTPTAPTAPANTNSTQIATTEYVQQELTDLIGGAPAAFDTLLEISASLASGDSNLQGLVDGKLSKASNLSDLTNTSTARTNLGVAIGTDVQAYNATLAAVAGGTYSGDDSITTIGTVTAGSVTAILPSGVVSGSGQINVASTTGDIALGTRTSGNYVASLVAGTGVTITNNSGEGATPTIAIGQAVATNSEVQFAKVGVGGAHDATYELKVTGDIGATGDIVAYVSSDERLKNNVEVISNPIEKVQSLRGVTWEWNELASDAAKKSPNVGVIAQEVEKVLPQLVHDRENGYKGVDYAKLTGLLIEAIKEQQKQIEELKLKLG